MLKNQKNKSKNIEKENIPKKDFFQNQSINVHSRVLLSIQIEYCDEKPSEEESLLKSKKILVGIKSNLISLKE